MREPEGGLDGANTFLAPLRPISVDGDLSDWRTVEFAQVSPSSGVFDAEASVADSAADLSFRFAVAYDSAALYVAVEVTDDVLVGDSTRPGAVATVAGTNQPWLDDAVEVFLDGTNNDAANNRSPEEKPTGGEFSLVHNGAATSDESGVPGQFGRAGVWFGVARVQAGANVVYEYRLNWSVMGQSGPPAAGIGFTLSVQDDDDGAGRDHALYWLGNPNMPWKDEAPWGTVRFLAP